MYEMAYLSNSSKPDYRDARASLSADDILRFSAANEIYMNFIIVDFMPGN